uniref:Uncharacterized protein n=1 Tax=Meloidogyne hapla TaxID=6305 RepID=A0A1I8BVV4_MELHA
MNDYLANTSSRSSEKIIGLLGPRNAACNRTIIVSKKTNRRVELPEVFSESETSLEIKNKKYTNSLEETESNNSSDQINDGRDKSEFNSSCELQGIISCNNTISESAVKSYDDGS